MCLLWLMRKVHKDSETMHIHCVKPFFTSDAYRCSLTVIAALVNGNVYAHHASEWPCLVTKELFTFYSFLL